MHTKLLVVSFFFQRRNAHALTADEYEYESETFFKHVKPHIFYMFKGGQRKYSYMKKNLYGGHKSLVNQIEK